MKIWELHNVQLGENTILTTPDGEANIEGLILSEKAYLHAIRDFRPQEIVDLVRADGPMGAAGKIVGHYRQPDTVESHGGRSLVLGRGRTPGPTLRRSDETVPHEAAFAGDSG